jgi:hypothetical protein
MITLLNGDAWGKDEILTQMVLDEFYYGHLGKYALSQSSLKTILNNPLDYLKMLKGKETKSSDALIMATLCIGGT